MSTSLILKLSCKDQPGIVAAVATFFAELGFNIEESSQHEDPASNRFFMRTHLTASTTFDIKALKNDFEIIATRYAMTWLLTDTEYKLRVVIAVSKWDHCLNNLLHNWKSGALPIDIVAVVSNHESLRAMVEWYNLPFDYIPIVKQDKSVHETQMLNIIRSKQTDLLVLARYMQVLSNGLCMQLEGQIINIHHSFLPGFKGSKRYHQAYERA